MGERRAGGRPSAGPTDHLLPPRDRLESGHGFCGRTAPLPNQEYLLRPQSRRRQPRIRRFERHQRTRILARRKEKDIAQIVVPARFSAAFDEKNAPFQSRTAHLLHEHSRFTADPYKFQAPVAGACQPRNLKKQIRPFPPVRRPASEDHNVPQRREPASHQPGGSQPGAEAASRFGSGEICLLTRGPS